MSSDSYTGKKIDLLDEDPAIKGQEWICVSFLSPDAVKKNDAYIKAETLATSLVTTAFDPSSAIKGREERVNGEICWLSLEKYAG